MFEQVLEEYFKKVDLLLIREDEMVYYLTGFEGSFGVVLLSKNEKIFITDRRYEFSIDNIKGFDIKIISKKDEFINEISNLISNKKVGLNQNSSLQNYFLIKDYAKEVISLDMIKLRAVKKDNELKLIQKAINVAESSLKDIIYLLDTDITERELARELEYRYYVKTADKSFPAIVASGVNIQQAHHIPDNTPLSNDLLIDFGAKYKRYCSDETITFTQNELYKIVKDAKALAVSHLKPGVLAGDLYDLAYNYFAKYKMEEFFSHGLGHGVGLAVHEYPSLVKDSQHIVKEGMVLTIEPGLYIKNKGGVRIEDMYLVTNKGYKRLTTLNDE